MCSTHSRTHRISIRLKAAAVRSEGVANPAVHALGILRGRGQSGWCVCAGVDAPLIAAGSGGRGGANDIVAANNFTTTSLCPCAHSLSPPFLSHSPASFSIPGRGTSDLSMTEEDEIVAGSTGGHSLSAAFDWLDIRNIHLPYCLQQKGKLREFNTETHTGTHTLLHAHTRRF
eukprot:GHVU01106157.1.p1 GENE.GHVU01106157.1~~GHVU01106157.1.p1  ORF type:complete len:173 (+),score=10.18 GHVU01106157.1:712-1230(+)